MKRAPRLSERSAGVLLPLASLPGPGPIGDLGASARSFVDFLAGAGQRWWQMLPVHPAGKSNSPYQSPSAFAGSFILISVDGLRAEGWLPAGWGRLPPAPRASAVDYEVARSEKERALRQAFKVFHSHGKPGQRRELAAFIKREAYWLQDYALYSALLRAFGERPWTRWPESIRARKPSALSEARRAFASEIRYHEFVQWVFSRQWEALRLYAARRGVGLLGDIPIFVAQESADVWAHPELFRLKSNGTPQVVAGVPPDYFTKTGQLWGNPTYRWNAIARRRYQWWIERLAREGRLFDAIRLDHFIGFVRGYEVPAGHRTAQHGSYRRGPGRAFFSAVLRRMPGLQLIAEDLGVVTPEVDALRKRYKIPGMHVLQFDWNKLTSIADRGAVYTGTHDNDTTRGWFEHLQKETKKEVCRALHVPPGGSVSWTLVETAYRSRARTAIVPVQDLLNLGSPARMNRPGTTRGNWRWRLSAVPSGTLGARLRFLTRHSNRL